MANLIDLHKIRQIKGKIRQNRHSAVLAKLDNVIKPVQSPYNVEERYRDAYYNRLKSIKKFSSGSIGYEADIFDSDYIYRLTTAYKLAKVLQENGNWIFNIRPAKDVKEPVFNDAFKAQFPIGSNWINLTRCAKRNLEYIRNFSFWTSEEYDYTDIVIDSFKVGIATDWFNDKLLLVLRCKFSEVDSIEIRVPTVIDAFDQPIFHPRKDNNSSPPKHGRAIQIDCNPLAPGKKEFVVGKIPTDKIEFKFVEMKNKASLGISFSDNSGNLWNKLDSYYRKL